MAGCRLDPGPYCGVDQAGQPRASRSILALALCTLTTPHCPLKLKDFGERRADGQDRDGQVVTGRRPLSSRLPQARDETAEELRGGARHEPRRGGSSVHRERRLPRGPRADLVPGPARGPPRASAELCHRREVERAERFSLFVTAAVTTLSSPVLSPRRPFPRQPRRAVPPALLAPARSTAQGRRDVLVVVVVVETPHAALDVDAEDRGEDVARVWL